MFRYVDQVKRRQPDIIVLHCGENDIRAENVSAYPITDQIIRLMEALVKECRVLIVGQLTDFPAHW